MGRASFFLSLPLPLPSTHPCASHSARRANRTRAGFMACRGAAGPDGSHQSWPEAAANLATSAGSRSVGVVALRMQGRRRGRTRVSGRARARRKNNGFDGGPPSPLRPSLSDALGGCCRPASALGRRVRRRRRRRRHAPHTVGRPRRRPRRASTRRAVAELVGQEGGSSPHGGVGVVAGGEEGP